MIEHGIEKQHLQPYQPLNVEVYIQDSSPGYLVRKNNVVHYKSNFYSVPQGTYTGDGLYVTVIEKGCIFR